jgi:hypothetical protein
MSVKLKNDSFTTVTTTGASTGIFDVTYVDATAGAVTITLPTGTAMLLGRNLTFKRIDTTANVVTITRGSSDTIDGATSVTLDITNVLVLIRTDNTAWRSMQLEGSSGAQTITTVTATATIDGLSDLYLINIAADATITLPAASTTVTGRRLVFRRIDVANFAATISRAGADTLTLTNSAVATTTTVTSSDVLYLTRTSASAWTVTSARPTFTSMILTADAPVTVTTNYDLWVAPTLAADRAFTLPLSAAAGRGKELRFSNSSAANNITLTRAGADVINAAATTLAVAANTGRTLTADGVTTWYAS